MHPRPPALLRQLIQRYGPTLSDNPRRVEGFLQDLCGQHPCEIFVIVHAQEAKIPAELLAAGALAGDAGLWQRLSRRLQDRMAFSPEAADRAVQSWALALNIQSTQRRTWMPTWLTDWVSGWTWGRIGGTRWGRSGVQWDLRLGRGSGLAWLGGLILVSVLLYVILQLDLSPMFAPWAESRETPTVTPSIVGAVAQLEALYPLPREVRIAAEEVAVHAEPSRESAVVARLSPLGAAVTIDGYSENGQHAHISQPISGWIEARLITHTVLVMNGAASYPVTIAPAVGRIIAAGVRVRQEPTLDAVSLGQVTTDDTVTIVAVTFDGRWYQIVAPMAGWVSGDYVELISNEGNS